ncbi:SRPBCC family protein [Naasia aerilata]|uniref:Activator of Hsp90 ATPase homologue 1/2-like C-terminal domain-containing protein n=1 Tax=Naasia aerilata TaxID=1162966 RepID=A0ABN6XMX3_9MICO|nr:SRPBCC domain-containing protein [Naasia aerilata]BDZ46269.1 hypothetical protein GCM10025866_21780 [Naasia aerilata]
MPDFTSDIEIRATREQVFEYLVTPSGLTSWLGQHAEVEPVEGGSFAVDIAGFPIRGRYVEVRRPERVVVSWGVAGSDDFPAGSSTVRFTLTSTDRGTRVELEHLGIPNPYADGHRDGWQHFLPRLAESAAGRAPADDADWLPLAVRPAGDSPRPGP